MPKLEKASPHSCEKKLKAAIIGLGNIGIQYKSPNKTENETITHKDCFLRHDRISEILGFDNSPKVLAKCKLEHPDVKLFNNLKTMLEAKPEIVSICSPKEFHAYHLLQAISVDTSFIWLEKPATVNKSERDLILKALNGSNSRVYVNYPRLKMKQFNEFARQVRQNLNSLKSIEVRYSRGIEENGVHLVSFILNIFDYKFPVGIFAIDSSIMNPSFVLIYDGLQIKFNGMELMHHCVEVEAYFDDFKISLKQSGQYFARESVIENDEFENNFLYSSPVEFSKTQLDSFSEGMFQSLEHLLQLPYPKRHEHLKQALIVDEIIENIRQKTDK